MNSMERSPFQTEAQLEEIRQFCTRIPSFTEKLRQQCEENQRALAEFQQAQAEHQRAQAELNEKIDQKFEQMMEMLRSLIQIKKGGSPSDGLHEPRATHRCEDNRPVSHTSPPTSQDTSNRCSNGSSDSRIGNQHIPEMDFNEDSKDLEILVQVHTQIAQEDTMKGNNRLDSLLQETSIGKVHSNSLETLTFTTEHEGMRKPTDFLVVNPIDDAHIVFEKMLVVAIYVDPLNSADVLGTQSAHKVLEEMSSKEIGFSETFFELKEFGYPSIVVRIDGTMALFFSHESLLRPFDRGKNTWVLGYENVHITSWITGLSSRLSFVFDPGGFDSAGCNLQLLSRLLAALLNC